MFVLGVHLVRMFAIHDCCYTGNILYRLVLRRVGLARTIQVVQSSIRAAELKLWFRCRDVMKDGAEDVEIGEEVDHNEKQECGGSPL